MKYGFSRIGKGGTKRYGIKGAGLFMTDGDVVLLLKRKTPCDEPNTWVTPGGKVNSGESDIGAARRETQEETGDVPQITRIDDFTDKDHRHTFKTFLVRIEKPYEVKISDESSDYEWVPLVNITDRTLHPGLKRIWPAIGRSIVRHFAK